ncbi:MAG: zinc-binding dehydrogenase [Planctomycetes bacterium]|nr:zinc-binding dehydrogenase [Planctomycetota bacterium]
MKAAYFTARRQLEILDAPRPALQRPGDVILQVATVGVCGSDVHYYTAGRIGDQLVRYPATLGHECAGVVVEVGANVTHVNVGDRVAVDPAISCGQCDQCRAGRPHTCRNLRFLGCPGEAPGAAAEYIAIDAHCCHKIPAAMTLVQATLIEPLSVGVYAQQLANMAPDSATAVLGAGPIGLSVLMAIQAACPARIYVTDLLDNRLALANQLGARWTGQPRREDVVASITEVEPRGLDCVFECAGQQETLDQGLELLRPGGTLIMVGILEADRVSFNPNLLRRKELRIQNVRRQNACVSTAIDLVAAGKTPVDALATHHFPMEETRRAFDLVAGYEDGVVKALIHIRPQ